MRSATTNLSGRDLRRVLVFLTGVSVAGGLSLASWSATLGDWKAALSTVGIGILISGSAALAGGLLGLLFGIPKSNSDPAAVQNPAPPPPPRQPSSLAAGEGAGSSAAPAARSSDSSRSSPSYRSRYAANSNLEQVSDWLTKIIVGVGLTQIPAIREYFSGLAAYLAPAFPAPAVPSAQAQVAAAVLIIYGSIGGFLAGYLLTRMFLPGAFDRAEEELRERAEQLEENLNQRDRTVEELRHTEGQIFADLYRPLQDEAFRRAIHECERLLSRPGQETNSRLWVYLAMAHGQAWKWEDKLSAADPATREQNKLAHRNAALEAVRNALKYGPTWKAALQMAWDPKFPAKPTEEDDLEVFYSVNPDDPFYQLLHR
jgi:hypothetical protein